MKKQFNYITINKEGYAELHGFKKIKKYVYCVPFAILSEGYMNLITHKGNKRSDSTKMKVSKGRIIKDKRFAAYVKNHFLEYKLFVYNKNFKEYRPLHTNIY